MNLLLVIDVIDIYFMLLKYIESLSIYVFLLTLFFVGGKATRESYLLQGLCLTI